MYSRFRVGKFMRFFIPKTRKKCAVFLAVALVFGIAFSYINNIKGWYDKTLNYGEINKPMDERMHYTKNEHVGLQATTNNISVKTYPGFETPRLSSVLIFTDSDKRTRNKSKLKLIFQSLHINYDFLTWNNPGDNFLVFPRLQDKDGLTRYHLFIFTSQHIYNEIDPYSKTILNQHCVKFNIGIIIFTDIVHIKGETDFFKFTNLPLSIKYGVMELKDLEITYNSLLKITKAGNTLRGVIHGKRHAIFQSDNPSFEPIAHVLKSKYRKRKYLLDDDEIDEDLKKVTSVIYDKGLNDGIRKVFFGIPSINLWLYELIFMDALLTLSNGILGYDLNRYIQIDIDDIFVGQTGKKLVKSDVDALVRAQDYFASLIPGFYFNLGYSGKFYRNSNDSAEREGDKHLVQNADKFRWFCHTFKHVKPHTLTKETLIKDFRKNKQFAQKHNIKVDYTYSVAPHHSGVYPIHETLYESWKEYLGIQVTSTEGYPHLYTAWGRKGFHFMDIQVLPRQTCGLFTGTLHIKTYPKGPDWLMNSSHGGELFWSILYNPITIFMTHSGNYGFKDRLAIHLFRNVTRFIRKWTNIKLRSDKPTELAKRYFELFPRQAEPIWTDPCTDLRHQRIWNETAVYCKPNEISRITRLPDVLVIGPQKSGSTALYTFMAMHPDLIRSRSTKHAYEEVQFFNRNEYKKGLRWYLDIFPNESKRAGTLSFEKSANYFDSLKSPLRAHSLVPNAKLVVISLDPKLRAYSWYQHMRSKKDPIALNHTFYEIISGRNKTDNFRFTVLQQRCLYPGLYAEALERWLQYYKPSQIHIVDGYKLRHQPHLEMKNLIEFLNIRSFPFHVRIKFNRNKGFYCATNNNGSFRCLGSSKGRKYEIMTDQAAQYLTDYYRVPNLRFVDMLTKLKKPFPKWLQKVLKENDAS